MGTRNERMPDCLEKTASSQVNGHFRPSVSIAFAYRFRG